VATSLNILVNCTANICRSTAVAMMLQGSLVIKKIKLR